MLLLLPKGLRTPSAAAAEEEVGVLGCVPLAGVDCDAEEVSIAESIWQHWLLVVLKPATWPWYSEPLKLCGHLCAGVMMMMAALHDFQFFKLQIFKYSNIQINFGASFPLKRRFLLLS